MHLDEVDKRILNQLLSNSRLSAREISSTIQVAPVTVINRMAKLEKEGLIKGYTAVIDSDYICDFQVFIHFSADDEQSLIDFLNQSKQVTTVMQTTGEKSIVAIGKFTSKKEMNEFIKAAGKMATSSAIEFIMKNLKEGKLSL
jgi:DNA-binding Lrp family transcriptional regulator